MLLGLEPAAPKVPLGKISIDAALAEVFDRVQREEGRLDALVNSVFLVKRHAPYLGKRFWETFTKKASGIFGRAIGTIAFAASWWSGRYRNSISVRLVRIP